MSLEPVLFRERVHRLTVYTLFEDTSSLDEDSKNIERWRQRKALSETGDFVEHHMPMVRSFPDKFGLLRYAISQLIDDEDGLVCEFGVYRGTTVNFIADLLPNVPVYGFDAFEGLPEDWRDGTVRGHFSLTELPEVRPNVQLFKGLFSDSLAPFLRRMLEGRCFFT